MVHEAVVDADLVIGAVLIPGAAKAMAQNPHLRAGLNIAAGQVTEPAVALAQAQAQARARAHGYDYVRPESAIQLE